MPKAGGKSKGAGGGIIGSTMTYQARGRFQSYGNREVTVTQGMVDSAERARDEYQRLKKMSKMDLTREWQSLSRVNGVLETKTDTALAILESKYGNLTMTLIDEKLGGMKFLNKK